MKYLLILAIAFGILGCKNQNCEKKSSNNLNTDYIYQTSTITALLEGVYDGDVSLKELKTQGNFGIGTFNQLDGEMVLINDTVFQVKSIGSVVIPNDTTLTPFASVTHFNTDTTFSINDSLDYVSLKTIIINVLPSKNIFYAIKISGNFDYIKTRSVPKQNKPYKTLAEIARIQPEFVFSNKKGELIGFILPEYLSTINVPGFHLHFLSNDRTKGGHLLDVITNNIKVEIDYISDINLSLLNTKDFYKTSHKQNKEELHEVEN